MPSRNQVGPGNGHNQGQDETAPSRGGGGPNGGAGGYNAGAMVSFKPSAGQDGIELQASANQPPNDSDPQVKNTMEGGQAGVESMSLLPEFQTKKQSSHDAGSARCWMPGNVWILHPYSTPRLAWDMWIVFLLVYTALVVPYSLAFQDAVCGGASNRDIGAEVLQWLVDVCFFTDIALNFMTGIMDPNSDNLTTLQLVSDWKVIGSSYLKGWFIMDVIGSFPVQVIESAMSNSADGCSLTALKALRLNRLGRLARLLKLLRLVRLARWNRLITKAKDALSINPGHIRLTQFVLFVFVLAHMLSCILYGILDLEDDYSTKWATGVTYVVPGEGLVVLNCPSIKFMEDSNEIAADSSSQYVTNANGERTGKLKCCGGGYELAGLGCAEDEMLPEAEPPIKYLISLYVTFTTLTTVGYGDITMQTTPELCFGIFMMALGASTFAVVVGNMAALLGKMDMRATAFKERMEDLDDFMHQENLPLDLRFRTRAFFEYGYNHSRDIPSSINELSKSLQTEVALHLYHDLITSVPFFCDCGKDFLTEIILKLKAQTLSPGDYLYEAGEFGDSMFFLIKGSVEVVLDQQNGVFAELREGSYFGENCLLGISLTRPVSVRAMSWCNIFCLNQEALEDCIADHPEAQDHFVRLAGTQTAEKTVTKAASRLQNIREGSSKTEEEMVAQSAASALGNFGKHDDPFGGVQPPVVTRALARAKHGASSSRKTGKGRSIELFDEERSTAFGDEIIHDLNKQHALVTQRRQTINKNLDLLHDRLETLISKGGLVTTSSAGNGNQ